MACPTCDHTMQGLPTPKGLSIFWCNRCGTVKSKSDGSAFGGVDEPLWIAGPEFHRGEVLQIVKREPEMVEHIKRLDESQLEQADIKRLKARVALLEHEADCHWCAVCSPGEWTRQVCPECRQLQEALEAVAAVNGKEDTEG